MTQNIEGKVVFITGASSVLGEATAQHLAAAGAKLVLGAHGSTGSRRSPGKWAEGQTPRCRPMSPTASR
jgi:NAD(P)-dependent dehydrogenase (short-subunit alcohol dehydrogenase family)